MAQHGPVELVRAPALAQAVPYAYAAVAQQRALVLTAGACPLDAERRVVGADDVVRQAGQVVANPRAALRAAGSDLSLVLKTTVYVASDRRTDLVAAWEVVRAAFGEHDAPSTLARSHRARLARLVGRGRGGCRPRGLTARFATRSAGWHRLAIAPEAFPRERLRSPTCVIHRPWRPPVLDASESVWT